MKNRNVQLKKAASAVLAVVILICAVPLVVQAKVADKPNIVVIMTDNQGYGDLGCYGGVRAETPRIDRLASEGIQFLDFQVEPGCSPSSPSFLLMKSHSAISFSDKTLYDCNPYPKTAYSSFSRPKIDSNCC